MSETVDLYEADFALWAETQARVLRDAQQAGVNLPLDWENVAEEIESLSRTDRRTIRSHLAIVIEHLLKLSFSNAMEPRRSWEQSVRQGRAEAEDLLAESPSLRREVPEMIEAARARAVDNAVDGLLGYGDTNAARAAKEHGGHFVDADVTGPWLPPEPDRP